ncbi:hypothetical protein QYM36_020096 [Artemia franciscana]|uniref:RING-type domain-containing protein n=1 Tax=Artemia franciscana TaxID=6661 RepID=A0AA88H4A4_ARTSF|nr:hypothetical protein QYM36_020096 [Artemia franciscana]
MDIFLLKSLNKKAVLLKNFKKLLSKLRNTFVRRLLADGPITLSQIQTESQLFQLSVRQLREILTTNRVDYRGLIEKSELFEKVVRLWNEIRSAKGADNLPDEELCKICMNAPVNCVILECGHMVSCVECGRQLAECPICRQFVVRVVRTFKA